MRRDQVRVLARRDDRLGQCGGNRRRATPTSPALCLVRLTTLHEMPSTTPRSRVARMTKRPLPSGAGQDRLTMGPTAEE